MSSWFRTVYDDWKQALKLRKENNDKQNVSGALFEIVIIVDKETGRL